ncbi:Voltage-dependent anion-selective channel protein 1 [Heterocephalus glaber]|uniref:Non-selective voltage-gated ion channel VDAC1 n=1 Tax=Heterocephalus glaber TaxID=10181 RepID=G5BVS2_HETGA|nr:Voltage-dependent anion-selective channel protein 1 [Heterocephalus glaber]
MLDPARKNQPETDIKSTQELITDQDLNRASDSSPNWGETNMFYTPLRPTVSRSPYGIELVKQVKGSLETKYRWTKYGLTFTEKWNRDNTLGTEITVEDQLAHGLKLTFNSSFGYKTDEFQLHTNVNDGTEFGGPIYQMVNKKLETAVNLSWAAGNSNTHFGIAAKYQIDPDACFSAKVNNSSLIGLGYTQTLKPGIKLTLSALLDGKNVNARGHKLGLGLEFQA